MLTADEQRVQMYDSGEYQRGSATRTSVGHDVDGRRAARTNVGQRCRRQSSSAYECRTAVHTNEVLQGVRREVGDVDGRRAAYTNVGQR